MANPQNGWFTMESLTLWQFNVAIENGPVEIVSHPINSMMISHTYVNVSQRALSTILIG